MGLTFIFHLVETHIVGNCAIIQQKLQLTQQFSSIYTVARKNENHVLMMSIRAAVGYLIFC